MEITLLHSDGCHSWKDQLDVLEAAIKESDQEVRYTMILVDSQEKADQYKFFGSPAIHIEGKDIDPISEKVKVYTPNGCRPYRYNEKNYEFAPKEMILEALKNDTI